MHHATETLRVKTQLGANLANLFIRLTITTTPSYENHEGDRMRRKEEEEEEGDVQIVA